MTTRVVATDAHEEPVYIVDGNALDLTSVPRRNGGPPIVAIKRLDLESQPISVVRAEPTSPTAVSLMVVAPTPAVQAQPSALSSQRRTQRTARLRNPIAVFARLVGEQLGVGQARGVVDRDVDVFPADPAPAARLRLYCGDFPSLGEGNSPQ